MGELLLRPYREADCEEILTLFYHTVHCVNAKDYTKAQTDAWAPLHPDQTRWRNTLRAHFTVVAEEEGKIVGFGDMDGNTGHFDRLYVHKEWQRKGIATKIADKLEAFAQQQGHFLIFVEASITARPFFEQRGYCLEREQTVERRGEKLTNYVMKKQF